MRFGAPVFRWTTPEEWVARHREWGYRTAYCPVNEKTPSDEVDAFVKAAADADITFAEVGAWVNVLDSDDEKRRANLEFCKTRLDLAERIGARCCVNIAGNRGDRWDGPSSLNYDPTTFEMIVETVREIIDAVNPTRTKYSLETMPYMVPDSAESSLEIVRAVDREAFGIHFDPINIVNSPRIYYNTGAMVRDFIERVGPHITALHLKDITMEPRLTVHLQEVRPGLGTFDTRALLVAVNQSLDADMPVLLEHLKEEEDYRLAHEYVAGVIGSLGV